MEYVTAREIADELLLGAALARLAREYGGYRLIAHWTQGEFHHDVLLQVDTYYVIVSTNCNGGIKEVMIFAEAPRKTALWHARCPGNDAFHGALPTVVDQARTVHWFDPGELLAPDARSELKPRYRRRQTGGGWEPNW